VTRGYFHATIELDCSRCLSRYRMQMDIPIEEELPIPGHAIQPCPESEEDEFAEEEIEPLFVDGIFDLTELLRQSILVAVPIKPLCSEECRGLCVHCGKNLNDGPCNCPSDIEPGPFEALAQLAEEQENEET
ncbi:MAG: YceD family protein, partial [Armatimonadota bacterium]